MGTRITRYPRALKFGELIKYETVDIKPTDIGPSFSSFDFLDLPEDIRYQVYRHTPLAELFRLAQTCTCVREEASKGFYSKRQYWFLYYPIAFERGLPGIAEVATYDPQMFLSEDLQAARKVRQLKISSAPLDLQKPADWLWISAAALWNKVLAYFPSLRRVMISVRELPNPDVFEQDFWKLWNGIKEKANIDIWFRVGSRQIKYHLLDCDSQTILEAYDRKTSLQKPHLRRSVTVEDFIRLPRMAGTVGRFLRDAQNQRYPRLGGLPGMPKLDFDRRIRLRWHTAPRVADSSLDDHCWIGIATMTLIGTNTLFPDIHCVHRVKKFEDQFIAQLLEDPFFKYRNDLKSSRIWKELQALLSVIYLENLGLIR